MNFALTLALGAVILGFLGVAVVGRVTPPLLPSPRQDFA